MNNFKLLIILILLGCQSEKSKPVTKVSPHTEFEKKQLLINASAFKPYRIVTINGINFDLVVGDIFSDTLYLATHDQKFITRDGFKIGTTFDQIPQDLRGQMVKEAGWGYYIKLNDLWNLAFCEGVSCTDSYPASSSTVKWIFKRK